MPERVPAGFTALKRLVGRQQGLWRLITHTLQYREMAQSIPRNDPGRSQTSFLPSKKYSESPASQEPSRLSAPWSWGRSLCSLPPASLCPRGQTPWAQAGSWLQAWFPTPSPEATTAHFLVPTLDRRQKGTGQKSVASSGFHLSNLGVS